MENDFDFYNRTNIKTYNLNSSMQFQLAILDTLDDFTRKHSENVANITCRLCEYLHKKTSFIIYCTMCAYLHDIGKVFIPPAILQKNGPLTDEEFEKMKTHTTLGYKMCMEDPRLRPYSAGPKFHHEALDGSGYPEGLTKKDIPIEGQIIRVAGEFDALTSKRQYKTHIGICETLKILIEETIPSGNSTVGKTNPKIVKALLKVVLDDTDYEISCLSSYCKHLQEQINRLHTLDKYYQKLEKAKSQSKKEYIEMNINYYLQDGETFENFKDILKDYENSYQARKAKIDKLFAEKKEIKKLKI